MRTIRTIAAAGIMCLLLVPTVARAGDLCINSDGLPIVGKNFKVPKPGKCRQWDGGYVGTGTATVIASGCTNTDGTTFRLMYLYLSGNFHETGRIELPYPTLTGGTTNYYTLDYGSSSGSEYENRPASAFTCNPAPPLY